MRIGPTLSLISFDRLFVIREPRTPSVDAETLPITTTIKHGEGIGSKRVLD
jgi:hypothetical protein